MNLKFVLRTACLTALLISSAAAFAQVSCARLTGDERVECERRVNFETKCKGLTGGNQTKCEYDTNSGLHCKNAPQSERCKALLTAHAKCRSQAGDAYLTCMRATKLIDR